MNASDFTIEPQATPAALYELAAEYERRCEAFDRTVCTGGVDERGSVRPGDARELGIINRHARGVWDELMARAPALGFTRDELRCEIRRQARY